MSSSSTSPMPATPAKRACDSCHRRKVKCLPIGEEAKPCRNCVSAGLECTFNNKIQKKGPKGSRAKVLLEIRETQKLISPHPLYNVSGSGSVNERRSLSPPIFERTPGLLTREILDACIEYFFKNMYRAQPILHPAGVMQTASNMAHCMEAYCTMAALCAYILVQPQSLLPPQLHKIDEFQRDSSRILGRALVDESIRCRRAHDWSENPTLCSIYTSYFLARTLHCLDRKDAAWIHLRQAVTVAHVLGLQTEEFYGTGDLVCNFTTRKLFWTLFITERLRRPLSLYQTVRIPDPKEEPEGPSILNGFIQLIKLYSPLDDKFFTLWNRNGQELSAHWLEHIQGQISASATMDFDLSSMSEIDLTVSRNWLRTLIWQLFLTQDGVASIDIDRAVAYKHMVELCREVMQYCSQTPQVVLEMHGLDLAEKICDIISIMSDNLSYLPYNYSNAARDYLERLITILLSLSSSYGRLAATVHHKTYRHFQPNEPNASSAMQTPSHFTHDGMNMTGQLNMLNLGQMHSPHSMSVQNSIVAPTVQSMDGTQFPALLTEVTSAEYMTFNAHHHVSAGAGQQSTVAYASYNYSG